MSNYTQLKTWNRTTIAAGEFRVMLQELQQYVHFHCLWKRRFVLEHLARLDLSGNGMKEVCFSEINTVQLGFHCFCHWEGTYLLCSHGSAPNKKLTGTTERACLMLSYYPCRVTNKDCDDLRWTYKTYVFPKKRGNGRANVTLPWLWFVGFSSRCCRGNVYVVYSVWFHTTCHHTIYHPLTNTPHIFSISADSISICSSVKSPPVSSCCHGLFPQPHKQTNKTLIICYQSLMKYLTSNSRSEANCQSQKHVR